MFASCEVFILNNDVFVKLNFKNIGEVRSLIVDKKDPFKGYNNGKYVICSGKYTKDGWTIVFKAKNYNEAEYIIENTYSNKIQNTYNKKEIKEESVDTPLDISILNKRTAFAY